MNLLEIEWISKSISKYGLQFFDKKTGFEISVNNELAKNLCQPVIENFKKRKVYARCQDTIWAEDLAEMELLSSKSKYLSCVMDVFTKYAWIKALKDKKKVNSCKCFYQNSKRI